MKDELFTICQTYISDQTKLKTDELISQINNQKIHIQNICSDIEKNEFVRVSKYSTNNTNNSKKMSNISNTSFNNYSNKKDSYDLKDDEL